MADKQEYQSETIRVTYDPDVCKHAAECLRGLPQVFNVEAKPWIQPEHADASAVAEQVGRCPTGALQYALLSKPE